MKKIILFLTIFLSTLALAGERVIINPEVDQDIKVKVNDNSVIKDAIVVTGSTGEVTFPSGMSRANDTTIHAYDAADQTITEAGADLNFATEVLDTLGEFTANTFTVTRSGNYRITITGSLIKNSGTSTIDTFQVRIKRNGSLISATPQLSANVTVYVPFANTVIIALTVGQTITASLHPNFGGGRTFSGSSRGAAISIERI
jgi:hypothetical protein